ARLVALARPLPGQAARALPGRVDQIRPAERVSWAGERLVGRPPQVGRCATLSLGPPRRCSDRREVRRAAPVDMDDVARIAEALTGVRPSGRTGLAEWRYHGRLVARQLDDVHVVIRANFDYRDFVLRQFPATFSVPARYVKHMMVVADLARGDAGAVE